VVTHTHGGEILVSKVPLLCLPSSLDDHFFVIIIYKHNIIFTTYKPLSSSSSSSSSSFSCQILFYNFVASIKISTFLFTEFLCSFFCFWERIGGRFLAAFGAFAAAATAAAFGNCKGPIFYICKVCGITSALEKVLFFGYVFFGGGVGFFWVIVIKLLSVGKRVLLLLLFFFFFFFFV
jgi:hypothetical protein